MKLFNVDSPFTKAMTTAFELVELNLLFLLCCLPIVTIGASCAALHTMARKILTGDYAYLLKGFFKAFKENFKTATLAWLPLLAAMLILYVDGAFLAYSGVGGPFIQFVLIFFSVVCLLAALYLFPLISHYDNSVRGHFKNSILVALRQLPRTAMLAATVIIPAALILSGPVQTFLGGIIAILVIGCSGLACLQERIFLDIFRFYDDPENTSKDED